MSTDHTAATMLAEMDINTVECEESEDVEEESRNGGTWWAGGD